MLLESGIYCASVAFPSGSDRKTTESVLWIQNDEMTAATALLSERSEAFISKLSPSWEDDRSPFLFWKIRRIPGTASFSFDFPCLPRRRVSSVGDWMAQITFLHISAIRCFESIDETKGNVREITMLLRETRAITRRRQWFMLRACVLCMLETDTCPWKPGRRRIEKRTSLGYHANNKQLHIRFIDFTIAFPSISHARVLQCAKAALSTGCTFMYAHVCLRNCKTEKLNRGKLRKLNRGKIEKT